MKESWRGPSVILGILGLLITIGIFWSQVEEQKREKVEREMREKAIQDSLLAIAQINEQRRLDGIGIGKRILWLRRVIPLYEDSLTITKTRYRRSSSRERYYEERLPDTLIYPPLKESYWSAFREFVFDLRDSARLEDIIYILRKEELQLTDSVKLYYDIDP